jgi:hypothetical protein
MAVAGAMACGGGGPDLPVPSDIAADTATDGQLGFAGARLALPLGVSVKASDGATVPRAEVRWTVQSGPGATVSDSITVTDGVGRAEVDVTLGDAAGAFVIRAALVVDLDKYVLFSALAADAPILTGVTPSAFSGGDTIVVSGHGLTDSLALEIGGTRARVVYVGALQESLLAEVPACLVPGPVDVRMRVPGGASTPVTGTFLQPASQLQLDVSDYVSLDPGAITGCATFPAAGHIGAQYLIVPQSTTTVPNMSVDYRLSGDSVVTMTVAGHPPVSEQPLELRFHDFLRRQEEAFAKLPKPALDQVLLAPNLMAGIEVGDQRAFRVCNTVTCNALEDFTEVTAEAKYVGDHAAIYLDREAPDTLTTAIFNELGAVFDEDLYEVATRAFGSESDVDQNGRVLILMTPVVNGLTPEADCEISIVTGFFFAIDLDPAFQKDQRSNRGEVFYALTPDPAGEAGCTHSVERVRRLVPVTFVHELQHMISYSQHVLVRGGPSEVLWLNEGLSHLSEELAALHFASLGDDLRFSEFAIGDLYNAYLYLENPAATYVLFSDGSGTLRERGGAWLLLRWITDQFGSAVTRRLVESGLTGAANVAAAAGYPFEQLVTEWTLANWASDLPDFPTPDRLKYVTWYRLRYTYGQLHAQLPDKFSRPFPIVPDSYVGGTFAATGTLRSGSGEYFIIEQLPGQRGFTLEFRDPSGGALGTSARPRLTVLRIR